MKRLKNILLGTMLLLICLLTFMFGPVPVAEAHESRPAYLEIKETASGRYELLWRTPLLAGMRLPVMLQLPEEVVNVTEPKLRELPDSLIERRLIQVDGAGLPGKRIDFSGLQATITDVLVRIEFAGGKTFTALVKPMQPWVKVEGPRSFWRVGWEYLRLGVDHILSGIDHLLFVLGLLLIVNRGMMLVKTITSFTIAHSITLAIATLGYASAPPLPLNAAIALSILFLGPEIVRVWRGQTSLTIRHPWVVAFAFGLLHGFGFASGLNTMGLPNNEIAASLLFFNLGVEAGQLFFVTLILSIGRSLRTLDFRWPRWAELVPGYVVGSLGAFWTIQRTLMMLRII